MNAILLAAALATADPQVVIRIDVVTTAEGPEVSVEVETHGVGATTRTTSASRVSKSQPTEFLYDPYALGCDHPSEVKRTGTFVDILWGEKPIHEHKDGVWHWWHDYDRTYRNPRNLYGKVTRVDSGTIPASLRAGQ